MSQTTHIEYAVYDETRCIESMCGSLKAARALVRTLKRQRPKTMFSIYRYDRSNQSDYNELVETI